MSQHPVTMWQLPRLLLRVFERQVTNFTRMTNISPG